MESFQFQIPVEWRQSEILHHINIQLQQHQNLSIQRINHISQRKMTSRALSGGIPRRKIVKIIQRKEYDGELIMKANETSDHLHVCTISVCS